ncbi:hypothetical protein NC797_08380 [Aquibacillus sp. 3ASR75-11]|uniref:Uncharacterized protein n=1 Tax=Terrihalobacillus insolitus TaxID=2950438 RepID=A0A9X4ALR6_9BACI|nr:hypothetical protein [Terrihalobacillus insolitus]MDC3413827.1 hypothetical protein [Terrihalobacillus insolitus]MDC3424526.1 hypothetical protein [Terrihalobacillus insolitus]
MLIQKDEFSAFKDFCRIYLKKERQGKSTDVLQGLKGHDRKLYRAIEKTVGKRKMKGYIGLLLRSVSREGWLNYEEKVWNAKPKWGYCTYCFSQIDDTYLIDIDGNQYCNSDCFDEQEAVPHYDAYADDYMFLFWDFEKVRDRYQYYLNRSIKKDFETHLDLTMILRDLYDVLNDSDYSTVLFYGGDDGPLVSEMYRILTILQEEAEALEKLLEQCKKVLPDTNERFSIEIIEEIMRKRKRPEVLREFIQTNRKYRNKENKNKWSTTDSMQRMNWYDVLTEEEALKNNVSWMNEVDCPQCKEVIDRQWSRRVPDGYFYCEKCYEELDFEFEFEEGIM